MRNMLKNEVLAMQYKRFIQYNTHWITGIMIALISQIYIDFFVDSFRLSLAVTLLPIFLVTINKEDSSIKIGMTSSICVFFLRFSIYTLLYGYTVSQSASKSFHGAAYYLLYGLLFCILMTDKKCGSFKYIIPVCFICDFIPNVLELCFVAVTNSYRPHMLDYGYLMVAALIRMVITIMVLGFIRWYHWFLNKEEHEERYQNLYLMTTELKNEIYFMKKNSEEVERVMGYAYNLCMELKESKESEELKQMALKIATEVHEIKKDYFRIIQGMEKQVIDQYDEENMSCEDMFTILSNFTHRTAYEKKLKIQFYYHCNDDFKTRHHHQVITVLKNMLTNSIEAIECSRKSGEVYLIERKTDMYYEFVIKDTGPGISDSSVDNIFKVGYSTKFDYKTGSIYRGMGLPAVKMIVEDKLGGRIVLVNRVEGTTFSILIPEISLTGGTYENIYNRR